ncbi:MAG: hypothetical protein ACR2IE_18200 [Candidatus Sumerlaeaceae bacterium]
MRKKGYLGDENPEKMPVVTDGIEMTRGTRKHIAPEQLTGGNGVSDESRTAKLVMDFIKMVRS